MKPKIVKPPKHLRTRVQWWCSTERGSFGGPSHDRGHPRAEAFRLRDDHRARGEAATVYRVEVRYKAKRVERA